MYHSFFHSGMIQRAVSNNILSYRLHHIRKYGEGNYRRVDDAPYGGGAGMLLKYAVLKKSLADTSNGKVILMSPRGKRLDQKLVGELSKEQELIFVCGHYEGVDNRFIERYVDVEVSVGDYILNGGETASMVIMEAVARKLECFMSNEVSHQDETFENSLLESDQYTRPREVDGQIVPEVLLGGNQKLINEWMRSSSILRTYLSRPDLLLDVDLEKNDINSIYNFLINR